MTPRRTCTRRLRVGLTVAQWCGEIHSALNDTGAGEDDRAAATVPVEPAQHLRQVHEGLAADGIESFRSAEGGHGHAVVAGVRRTSP